MRWMMIAFLGSLAALLLVAAGVARRIWLHRRRLRNVSETGSGAGPAIGQAGSATAERSEEPDQEL
jgi:hypothetical protein